jgi:hypothetical protein
MLTLKASNDIVCESVGSGLSVETGEKRGGGNHAQVGVVETLVGAKGVQTTNRRAIDQTGRDVVELSECQYVPMRLG